MAAILTGVSLSCSAQKKKIHLDGLYIQWGYNTEWYTRSNIHFNSVVNGVNHNFTIYRAKAHDRNDMDGIYKKPLDFSVPQYNYRIGFYLNKSHTRAIEFNYDHTKYIVYDDQRLRVRGNIGNDYFDKDTSFAYNELHFEHTNGANFYQINYVEQIPVKKVHGRTVFSAIWKLGAGIVFPKTDIMLSNYRVDNRFHVAGYCLGAEGGARYYLGKRLFLEATGKAGFANYLNALGAGNGRVNHHFGYFEVIGLLGYDIRF
ncbi:MAG: hypothetical protein IPI66_11835 [Chitinophagaceae bacterium]|nr:hypothetical protein [Chitinophagaceae bacterium]MBL0056161.1 hypothetical protein [Chitinophagaceae bacterium]